MHASALLQHWDIHFTDLLPADSGLINETFLVRHHEEPVAVLQRLNTDIFAPTVHHDTDAIAAHVEQQHHLTVPRLIPTRDQQLWVETTEGAIWRLMTVVGQSTMHALQTQAEAESAGYLVGRFHAATSDVSWSFRHVRPGAHDTDAHMAALTAALAAHRNHRLYDRVAPLAERIIMRWRALRPRALTELPQRIIHGDLKVSNLRFDGECAVALIDLDTLAWGTLDVELGDAMRSWCVRTSEDHAAPRFDVEMFQAAMTGYVRAAGDWGPTEAEWLAIVPGTERIATELAARFALDALRESYFGWDPERFATAGDHNLLRAKGQAALAANISTHAAAADQALAQARA